VGPGIFLLVLGAVFTFAVRQDTPLIDLQVTGVIFMTAGAALVYLSSRSRRRERSVVTRDDLSSPSHPQHEVHETVVDHEPWGHRDDQPQGRTNL
jgi:membrane protein implicated in regulation of membrane protease activity